MTDMTVADKEIGTFLVECIRLSEAVLADAV